ncbi:MAG: glycosyltransferase [Verrucomicrobiota bacterium]
MSTLKLLYHCAYNEGGLARYALEQRRALAKEVGIECSAHKSVAKKPRLHFPGKLGRVGLFLQTTIRDKRSLAHETRKRIPDWLLLSSWGEYLAPLWAHHFRRLRDSGTRIAAIVHDPVRDYVRGPNWFHQASIRAAYSFVDAVFVHDASEISWGGLIKKPLVVEIPCGPFPVPTGTTPRARLRADFNIPDGAFALLSFGHIRDAKNLDLILHALGKHSMVHLIVAGREQSGGQKPVEEYQQLATKLGVADRCHWFNEYIPEEDVWKYFTASDSVALTYSSDFRSASGVLNVNVQFRKPILASCGPSPLKTAVEKYNLGPWVEPDSSEEIERGLERILSTPNCPDARWEEYLNDNSWEENARRVVEAMRSFGESVKR